MPGHHSISFKCVAQMIHFVIFLSVVPSSAVTYRVGGDAFSSFADWTSKFHRPESGGDVRSAPLADEYGGETVIEQDRERFTDAGSDHVTPGERSITGRGAAVAELQTHFQVHPDFIIREQLEPGSGKEEKETFLSEEGASFTEFGRGVEGIEFRIKQSETGPDGWRYMAFGFARWEADLGEGKHRQGMFQEGGVAKCRPDGSEFTLLARGIRDPVSLFFNQTGDLFVIDKMQGPGEATRLLWILEGGDYGWRPQPDLLEVRVGLKDFAPYYGAVLPAITGLPGVVNSEIYSGRQGQEELLIAGNGLQGSLYGVRSMRLVPSGAGYVISENHAIVDGIGVVGIESDRAGQISLFENGDSDGLNSIRWVHVIELRPGLMSLGTVALNKWVDRGLNRLSLRRLIQCLSHPSGDVRYGVQQELVNRYNPPANSFLQHIPFAFGNTKPFEMMLEEALNGSDPRARWHSIWGAGQIARERPELGFELSVLLDDPDPEIRLQTVRVLASIGYARSFEDLHKALHDVSLRVRMAALRWWSGLHRNNIQSLPALNENEEEVEIHLSIEQVIECFRQNSGEDPSFLHASAMALVEKGYDIGWRAYYQVPSLVVRRTFMHALKLLRHPDLSLYLDDPLTEMRREAAFSLFDNGNPAGYSALALLLERDGLTVDVSQYAILSHFKLGKVENYKALMRYALTDTQPDRLRNLALDAVLKLAGMGSDPASFSSPPVSQTGAPFLSSILISFGQNLVRKGSARFVNVGLKILAHFEPESIDKHQTWTEHANLLEDATIRILVRAYLLRNPDLIERYDSMESDKRNEFIVNALTGMDRDELNSEIVNRLIRFTIQMVYQRAGTEPERPSHRRFIRKQLTALLAGDVDTAVQLDLLSAATRPSVLDNEINDLIRDYYRKMGIQESSNHFDALYSGGDPERGRRILESPNYRACFDCHSNSISESDETGLSLKTITDRELGPKQMHERLYDMNNNNRTSEFTSLLTGERIEVETHGGSVHVGVINDRSHKGLVLDSAIFGRLSIPTERIRTVKTKQVYDHRSGLRDLTWIEYRDLLAYLGSVQN